MRRQLTVPLVLAGFIVSLFPACATNDRTDKEVLQKGIENVFVLKRGTRVTRIYGPDLANGNSVELSGKSFIDNHASTLGIEPDELRRAPVSADNKYIQPVMYDRENGVYKFNLVKYRQLKNEIPVFRADLKLLMRRSTYSEVVSASSSLRNLKGFVPKINNTAITPGKIAAVTASIKQRTDFKGKAVAATTDSLINFTEPEMVIWAGTEDVEAEPRVAVTYIGDNYGQSKTGTPERWLFVADPDTGEILYKESLIQFTDVAGHIGGMVTDGPGAMQCFDEALSPFTYARATIAGGNTAYTDALGDFTIPFGGSDAVSVASPVSGRFFDVQSDDGINELLTTSVVPPGPAEFIHNQLNVTETIGAQANGYAMANEVRNWALRYNPSYPVVGEQTDFPVNVNLEWGYCPGNAWYDGSSINFCKAGDGYANTSFASVLQHEYAHHLIEVAGSGQEEYGEGMADVVSMLIADDPGLAYGFYYDLCDEPLRRADNNCQYDPYNCSSCGGEIHDCGMLLSGIVWSIRNALQLTEPENYLEILSNIALNSILIHQGWRIDEQVAIDFLTMDDTDGNLANGSPHWDEICGGFEAHGIACPELLNYLTVVVPAEATEGDGVLADAGTVSIAWAIEEDLVVYIASHNMDEVEVYGRTIIPAGRLFATFDITIKDDAALDGSKRVRLTGLAPDMVQGITYLEIHDNETAVLSVNLPEGATEGETVQGEVVVDRPVDSNVTVKLTTDDASELSVPALITIPAGATSATFDIVALNDQVFDGNQIASVTASVVNWTAGTALMEVRDDLNLHMSLPTTAEEGAGVLYGGGTITISGTLPSDLEISLVSDNLNEVQVPGTIVLPAGMSSTSFDLTIVDDAVIDGTVPAVITAAAAGFQSATGTINVDDNDPGTMAFEYPSYAVSETGGSVVVTVLRHPSDVGTISVDYQTVDMMAVAGEDYVASAGTLTFEAGQTAKRIEVTILDDTLTEGHEMFGMYLSNPTDGGKIGPVSFTQLTIRDDDIIDYFSEGFWVYGGGDGDTDGDSDTDTDTGTDTDTDADSDADTDTDNDTESDSDSDSDMGKAKFPVGNGTGIDQDFDLSYKTLTLTPNGSKDFYGACIEEASAYPVDPTGGANIPLSDDSYAAVTLADDKTVSVYYQAWNTLFVGSNGYITFGDGDSQYWPEFWNHFRLPRVAGFYSDLYPPGGSDGDTDGDTDGDSDGDIDTDMPDETAGDIQTGAEAKLSHAPDSTQSLAGGGSFAPVPEFPDQDMDAGPEPDTDVDTDTATDDPDGGPAPDDNVVSWKQLEDRVVITYNNIPQCCGNDTSNNFQIELFYDGVLRITWLRMDTVYGIVGISQGNGYPDAFYESNMSEYSRCSGPGCQADSACDDGAFCNGAEMCVAGACIAGDAPVCDDGIDCTIDACDDATQSCASLPDDTRCGDDNACTLDLCTPDVGCTFNPIPGCCGNGQCESGEDPCGCPEDCGEPPASEAGLCADGVDNDCDGAVDRDDNDCACSADWTVCISNDACCSGRCRRWGLMKRCVPAPKPACGNDVDCDDGKFCNGSESCASGKCRSGAAPCPPNACDEASDTCALCSPKGTRCTVGKECCSNGCRGPWFNRRCD